MKNDVAGGEYRFGRQFAATTGDAVVGRRQHPQIGAAHSADVAAGAPAADEFNRGAAFGERVIVYIAGFENALIVPQARERASDATAADDIEPLHVHTLANGIALCRIMRTILKR
jgi:hypothetical protein